MKFNPKFLQSVNRIVRFFIFSDLLLWSGWGFIDPLFSIFVIKNVAGATLVSIGMLATIYWITKGFFQIPVSLFLDKTAGEQDDFYAMIFGLIISAVAAFSLMLAETMSHIYIIQFIKSIGFALYIPAWSAIVSRHLDKEHTAFEWALSSSSVSFGIGAAGFLGGVIANSYGFNFLFLMVGLFGLSSACVLLFVPDLILPRKTNLSPVVMDHVRTGLK